MNRVAYDQKQWDVFWKSWEKRLETLPGAKKAALAQAGKAVERVLHERIDESFSSSPRKGKRFSPREHVKRWQELRLGSGGGYAAMSPKNVTVRVNKTNGNKHNATAITRYLERGHKVRSPYGRWKRYQPRYNEDKMIWGENGLGLARGRMFYSWAHMKSVSAAKEAAKKEILDWIERFAEADE